MAIYKGRLTEFEVIDPETGESTSLTKPTTKGNTAMNIISATAGFDLFRPRKKFTVRQRDFRSPELVGRLQTEAQEKRERKNEKRFRDSLRADLRRHSLLIKVGTC